MCFRRLLALGILLLSASASFAQPQLGFEAPPGFEVTLYADDALATDIHCLTFDSKGRVVVSGRNYIKILEDANGDGKADRAILFSNVPKNGAHGMAFDGNDCIAVGDEGVRRLIDRNGDGEADEASPVWIRTKNDNEHAANALIRGADGAFYLICGNDAGIGPEHASSKRSPVKKPNSGTVLRLTPDGKSSEIVADGFRNPYGLAIGPMGNLFTVDSDGERIYRLPYYAPTRLFDIGIGQHHGWLQHGWVRSWSRPTWFPDAVERLVEIGRGSPTGLHVYRHRMFPERYRNGVFSLCWTFGRIYFFPLEADGSTFKGKAETFVKTVGDVGFAPTSMAVGPDGALYVSIGGRGTRGSVFRIAYKGKLAETPKDDLHAMLEADEPTSAWSRARWMPLAKKIVEEDRGDRLFRIVIGTAEGTQWSTLARIRAAEILAELKRDMLRKAARAIFSKGGLAADKAPVEVAARVIALSCWDDHPDWDIIARASAMRFPQIARAAWEGMLRATPEDRLSPPWLRGLNHGDRRVRAATLKVAAGPGRADFEKDRKGFRGWGRCADQLAALWVHGTLGNEGAVRTCIEALEGNSGLHLKLDALRLIQLAMNDVDLSDTPDRSLVGYAASDRDKLTPEVRTRTATSLAKLFPTGTEPLDLELARTLGMLGEEVPGLPERFFSPKRAKAKDAETDLHYLLCFTRIPGTRPAEVTRKTAETLNSIYVRYAAEGHKPADHAPAILESMFDHLLKRDPALGQALAADAAFGTPGQELLAARLTGETQRTATRKLLKAIERLDEDKAAGAWNPDLVKLVAQLPPEEGRPILREQFRDPRLSDAIALVLASPPDAVDVPRFVESLQSSQPRVAKAAADALVQLKQTKAEPKQIASAVQAIRRFSAKEDAGVRASLDRLLSQWTGETATKDDGKLAELWTERFGKLHPNEAKSLTRFGGANFAQWKQRLDGIDWSQGNATKGEAVFHRQNCYRCHVDARRLGPDLAGVAQRFSVHDLFVAIIDPNKDIAPAYRGLSIVTTSGKIYTGMMVYQSNQLTLLQTTPDLTARVAGPDIARVQPATVSFMPSGLLDGLQDRDLADLLAYLKTLRKK
ncbi:MAG: c-type cytochrome [Gemmataceae bacterium]|nr:c-type cytochrome [Gemmataceae bacterium]